MASLAEQLRFTLDEPAPKKPKLKAVKPAKKAKPKGLARGEFEPINPPNLAQESALWLTGQRSIAEQRGGYFVRAKVLVKGKWRTVSESRGARYVPAGIKHPGKMQPDVCGAIFDTYTKPGDHVVDFMGGQGTTGVEGAERGRHVTIVELVRHWANVAYANACRTMYRGAPGSIRVLCGDARNLVQLLNGAGADAVVTSPPYGEAINQHPAATDREARIARMQAAGINVRAQDIGGPQSITTAPQQYSADAVITSPAYGDIRQDGGNHQFGDGSAMDNYTAEARVKSRAQRDQSNVGNKRYGTMDKAMALIDRLKAGETVAESEWPGLCYLEDMALIYRQALQILRPGGLIILVLKDYRRNKARVNLVGDTMRLLEAIGFIYHDRALALTSKIENGQVISKVSPFVRVNARKPEKNGGKVLLPAGEEVLVYRKE